MPKGDGRTLCPTMRPTREEFEESSFTDYVRKKFLARPDMACFKVRPDSRPAPRRPAQARPELTRPPPPQVVPPKGWSPRAGDLDAKLANVTIATPIKQHVSRAAAASQRDPGRTRPHARAARGLRAPAGPRPMLPARAHAHTAPLTPSLPPTSQVFGKGGAYMAILEEQHAMAAPDFRRLALSAARAPPGRGHARDDMLERAFWSALTVSPPLYGADTPVSLFDLAVPWGWNLRALGGCLLQAADVPDLPGVTSPMTYFGSWKSFFGWHKEDMVRTHITFSCFLEPPVEAEDSQPTNQPLTDTCRNENRRTSTRSTTSTRARPRSGTPCRRRRPRALTRWRPRSSPRPPPRAPPFFATRTSW